MSVKLFATGAMRRVEVESVTSEATGYDIENALDFCLKTYWKPTTTGDQTIVFDLQVAQKVDAWGLFIHNYETDHGPTSSPEVVVSWSDDNVSWTGFDTCTFEDMGASHVTNGGLVKLEGFGAQTRRYWKFVFQNMATTIEISQFLLMQRRTVSVNPSYPTASPKSFGNLVTWLHTNERSVAAGSSIPFCSYQRKWTLFLSADADTMEAAYDGSYGDRFPIIYQETTGEHMLMYITSSDFSLVPREHEVWDLSLNFVQVPYLPDGEVF